MAVLSGERWASAGAVTTVTWSFATSNYASLKTDFSGYKDFESSINVAYRATIEAAFGAWEAVANIDFVLVADAPTVNIRVGNFGIDGRAGPGQTSTLGIAQSWWVGAFYKASQIYFDVDAYDDNNLYQIAVHEIGHAIGLEHSPLNTSVMYYLNNPLNESGALSADDVQGVVSIYGAKGAVLTDDFAGSPATTGAVSVGGAVAGRLETANDVDWFRVNLVAGRTYRLNLEGEDSGQGTLPDPLLEVRSSTGALLQTFDDGGVGVNSRGDFTATTGGVYFLAATSFADTDIRTGTYRLSVADVTPAGAQLTTAALNILRVSGGSYASLDHIVRTADATTSVATLAYQFFTGKIPSAGGIDYLVSPTGPNPNNLNSAYYQSFNLENRYINFAVNLGKEGEGKAQFAAAYGGLTLSQATKKAYDEIFGLAPTDAKVAALLSGGRDLYFEAYGRDGVNGVGTKAAMVGWLLAEAEKGDIGMYARSNAAFLTDLADGATFAVDLIGTYGKAEFDYGG